MIIKIERRTHPFVQIDRRVMEDDRLSYKARGILGYLLSRPPDWEIRMSDLENRSKNDGVTAIQSGMQELKDCGYAELETVRTATGVGGTRWIVREEPKEVPDKQVSCPSGNLTVRKSAPTNKKEVTNKQGSADRRTVNAESFNFGINGHSTRLGHIVKEFADFTTKYNLHQGQLGSTNGGWKPETIKKWNRALQSFLQDCSEELVEEVFEWYLDHCGQRFVPEARTFTSFLKKFGQIKEVMDKQTGRGILSQQDQWTPKKIIAICRTVDEDGRVISED